ncbi:hypothetical protein POM88_048436 [Heracleum sosnowskyi]|uniref:Helitron helicase-like domain-containing protein n=1 Tax=Heracleum sosnowskyi TaxID=360622 RepID=A0AAD8GW93_9APIA|nr:hypothetical protein POM88_048436 [Heracleum sosnowskyi]
MEEVDQSGKSCNLFTKEDMILGFTNSKTRKRKLKQIGKENISANSSSPPTNTRIINTPPLMSRSSIHNATPFSENVSVNPGSRFDQKSAPVRKSSLSDITNIGCTLPNAQKNVAKMKSILKEFESSRNLFDHDFNMDDQGSNELYDDQIENSIVDPLESTDDEIDLDDATEDYWNDFAEEEDCDNFSDSDDVVQTAGATLDSHVKQSKKHMVPEDYATLGPPSVKCSKCNAQMWKEERVNKNVTKGLPIFSMCCKKGEVKLPAQLPTPSYLSMLYADKEKGPSFERSIRLYNSMFSFTSTGGNVDHSINTGRGPYIYRLNGQNHHVFGSLIPDDGETPKFCQLYIYDTTNEVNNRLRWVNVSDEQVVDAEIVQGLITMLDETNELVEKFRTTRDRFENNDLVDLKVELKVCRSESGQENHISATDEVAGIMIDSSDNSSGCRDIIIETKMNRLERVSYIHPKLMALQYPLLFPNGEDGYHNKIPFQSSDPGSNKDRDFMSMKDYYSYHLQVRENEAITPRLGGRLFQQAKKKKVQLLTILQMKNLDKDYIEIVKDIANQHYTLKMRLKEMNIVDHIQVYSATNICHGFKNQQDEETEYTAQASNKTTSSTYNLGGTSNLDSQST